MCHAKLKKPPYGTHLNIEYLIHTHYSYNNVSGTHFYYANMVFDRVLLYSVLYNTGNTLSVKASNVSNNTKEQTTD